jgi:centractin
MADTLHNAPIVLDNGSGTIRAGFAGEDLPKCYFPSFVGRPKHLRVLAGALEGDVFIGQRAQDLRGLLKIRYPLEHGIVTDWDDMERIWEWVYGEGLKTLSEEVSWFRNGLHFALLQIHDASSLPDLPELQKLISDNSIQSC